MNRQSLNFLFLFSSFFQNNCWCIGWFGKTLRRIIEGGGVDMQSLKFSFLVFFIFQIFLGNLEKDNRRRRSGYALPVVFFPCLLLFSKYLRKL